GCFPGFHSDRDSCSSQRKPENTLAGVKVAADDGDRMSRHDPEIRGAASVAPQPVEEQLSLFSPEVLKAIQKDEAKWRQSRKAPWKKDFTTVSGMEVNPLSTPVDVANLDFHRDLGFPGTFPFTRGVHPAGY